MSQVETLRRHLAMGNTITNLEAIGVFRIFNLKGRINDLRNTGFRVETVMKEDSTGKKYASYRRAA